MYWAYSVPFSIDTKIAFLANECRGRCVCDALGKQMAHTDTQTEQSGLATRFTQLVKQFLRYAIYQIDSCFRRVGKEKGLVIPFGRGVSQRPRRWLECKHSSDVRIMDDNNSFVKS